MKPEEKAAERWRKALFKKNRIVEKEWSKSGWSLGLEMAFIAGVKWRHDNADCEGCYKKGIKEGYAKAKKEAKR